MGLTPAQEDYIEAVYRRLRETPEGVRVTDLAADFGCRLPTVTRTVRALAAQGYLEHESRRLVRLTAAGLVMARDIAHRHDDVVSLLEVVLGLPPDRAEADACQIEHGLSKQAADALHALLNYIEALPAAERTRMQNAVSRAQGSRPVFQHLGPVRSAGWRG